MKASFEYGFRGMSGKRDNSIFYYHRKCGVCVVRSKPKAEPNARTEKLKAIMGNLQLLNPTQGYKQDFKDYLEEYNNLKENRHYQLISWNNLYLKVLYKLAKTNPNVKLLTITREQIYTENLPCISVKAAIETGLLPQVANYERYDNVI